MNDINWPQDYLPGTTDFYVANETIVAGVSSLQMWPFLADTTQWPIAYAELGQIQFHDGSGPTLSQGARFQFVVGGVLVQAEINEYIAPIEGSPGRLAWHGWVENEGKKIVDAHCGWLIEDLVGGRVRVLWKESLIGSAAEQMAKAASNPAVVSHQDWVEGIAKAALAACA